MSRVLIGFLSSFFIASCVSVVSPSTADLSAPNAVVIGEGYTSAGQPSEADISTLKELDYSRVVDLRGVDENRGFDEKTAVEMAGMDYELLPISGAVDLTVDNAKKLHDILGHGADETFVHCGSGNRVGALMAVRAYHFQDADLEEAIEIGRNAGMTGLEESVRSILSRE